MTGLHDVVLLGGPRDGEPNLAVPAVGPPLVLPGCCITPRPRDGVCAECGATGRTVGRYQLHHRTEDTATYRHVPPRPQRQRTGTTT